MTSRRTRGPLALGALLGPATQALRLKHGRLPAALVAGWEQIAGPALARRCRPVRFVAGKGGGTLTLAVDGPAGLELQHLGPTLIARVNACLGSDAVARLKLRPGRIAAAPVAPAVAPAAPRAAAPDADADPLAAALANLGHALRARR